MPMINLNNMKVESTEQSLYNLTPQQLKQDAVDRMYDHVNFPSLVSRIKAVFVDMLLLLVVFTITSIFIDSVAELSDFTKGSILIFMVYLYDPLMTSLAGGTLGHKMMEIKVRRYVDPKRNISLPMALIRFLVKGLLGWLSFLTVTGSMRKRAIHDLLGGSIVMAAKD
jgi:uncharacterized RDD family membrane protein YckC